MPSPLHVHRCPHCQPFAPVLAVRAVSHVAFDRQCQRSEWIAGTGQLVRDRLKAAVREQTATAVAEAIATVRTRTIGEDTSCQARAVARTGSFPGPTETTRCNGQCAARNSECAGRLNDGESFVGCCDPADVCVQVSNRRAKCKRDGSRQTRNEDAIFRSCGN